MAPISGPVRPSLHEAVTSPHSALRPNSPWTEFCGLEPKTRQMFYSSSRTKTLLRAEAERDTQTLSQPEVLRERCILLTTTAVTLSSTIWEPQFSSINALNLKTSSPNYTLGTKKAKPFPSASYLVVLCCLNSWLR